MTGWRTTTIAVALLASVLWACSQEDAFTDYRDYQPCNGNFPACRGKSAGCFLDEDGYLEGEFPGGRRFLVVTEGQADIKVHIFFRTQTHPGAWLNITWYEPACRDLVEFDEEFDDLFSVAGDDRILTRTETVYELGEHLIEVQSDAHSEYLIKVEIRQ